MIYKNIFCVFTILLFSNISSVFAETPNVVLIISDDQSWTDYGFMEHPEIQTPHLDQLAKESLTFTRGYVPTSLCRPSLATMLSGTYAYQHRISGNDPKHSSGLRPWQVKNDPEYNKLKGKLIDNIDRVPSIVKMLGKEKGYLSHQSGKWWEGNFKRGGFTHGMTRGFPQRGGRHGDDGLRIGRKGLKPVLDFIDQSQKNEKPFFVWYAPFLPHSPHTPPERFLKKYKTKTDSIHKARYWAMCEWFDETCGQLLSHIKKQNLDENTIIIYVCDNGWIQNEQNKGYSKRSKQSPYEGGIRTPIMVRWTGKAKPFRDEKTLVSSIDIAPTVLHACGIKPTAQMSGINLLDSKSLACRTTLFGDLYDHDVANIDKPVESLRYLWCIENEWKLILPSARTKNEKSELYNVVEDPHEKKDLAAKFPERVKELELKITNWYQR